MKRRVRRVVLAAMEQKDSRYSRPKFVTFALPTEPVATWEERESLRDLLKSRLPRARKVLEGHGMLGGVYVIEMTSRRVLEPPADGRSFGTWMWKHHPHVHMACVFPVLGKKAFRRASDSLIPMGLGRLNIRAFDDDDDADALKKLEWYIAKYLNKDGERLRSFGILRVKRG